MMTPEELIQYAQRQAHKNDVDSEIWFQILDRLLVLDKIEKENEEKRMILQRFMGK